MQMLSSFPFLFCLFCSAYKAKTATNNPTKTLPRVNEVRSAPEAVRRVEVGFEAETVPLEAAVEATTARVELAGIASVVAPASTEAGAVPTTRAAEAVLDPVTVVKIT